MKITIKTIANIYFEKLLSPFFKGWRVDLVETFPHYKPYERYK